MTRMLIPPSSDVHQSIYVVSYEGGPKMVTLSAKNPAGDLSDGWEAGAPVVLSVYFA